MERERESACAREKESERARALLKSRNVERPTNARIPACAHTERFSKASFAILAALLCLTMRDLVI
jgi:hypothetical protein